MTSIFKIHQLLKNTKTSDYKNFEPIFIELEETRFISFNGDTAWEELSEQINKSIGKLTPRQNMVLKLRFWEGLSPQEIADLLKFNRRKVYDILNTSIKILKMEFADIKKP